MEYTGSNLNYVNVGNPESANPAQRHYLGNVAFCKTSAPKSCNRLKNFHLIAGLDPCLNSLHSIILVGSAAHGKQSDGSDVDLVLIAKDADLDLVCEHVFGLEIDASLAGKIVVKKDFTILSGSQVEELFKHGSPFAFAVRYGKVIYDNGYFRTLNRYSLQNKPSRKYCVKSLFENIASQYYLTLNSLDAQASEKSCSLQCCQNLKKCQGLSPAAMLPKLIFRMLYLVLPSKGIIPLTKDDATEFAAIFYDETLSCSVRKALRLARNGSSAIRYQDYRELKKTAVKLFQEIISILGLKQDVLEIIRDASHLAKGEFGAIKNPELRTCVV